MVLSKEHEGQMQGRKYRTLCIYIYDKSTFVQKKSVLFNELYKLKSNEWEEVRIKKVEEFYKKMAFDTGIEFRALQNKMRYEANKGTIKYEIDLRSE